MTDATRNKVMPLERLRIRLIDIDIFTGVEGNRMERRLATTPALVIPIHGSGELELDAGKIRLQRDHVYPVRTDTTFGIRADRGGELTAAILRFDAYYDLGEEWRDWEQETCADAKRQAREAAFEQTKPTVDELFRGKSELAVPVNGRLAFICRSIDENRRSRDPLKRWRAELDTNELIYYLLSESEDSCKDTTEMALERVKAFMQERFHEDLSIERLASVAELSAKYFVDVFKKTYGVSAIDYLTNVRMDEAKRLLLRQNMLMKEVAHQVGYADEFYFSRKFKKFAGMSPTAFIQSRSRRIAVYDTSSIIGFLIPLGIIPYAAPLHPMWTKLYSDRYGVDIPIHLDGFRMNRHNKANIEQLKAAKPDIIICSHEAEEWERKQLEEIAPLIVLPPYTIGWEEILVELGQQLGAEQEAKLWIEQYTRKAQEQRKSLESGSAGTGNRALLIRMDQDQLYIDWSATFHDVMHKGLGFQSAYPEATVESSYPVTISELAQLETDWACMLIRRDSETLEHWKSLQEMPAWNMLRFVREERLRMLPSDPWREYSPIAIERCLGMTSEMFASEIRK
ncbi:helix-turn-helix domain-containing protein [Paenibacillus sp. strain BS8-2]